MGKVPTIVVTLLVTLCAAAQNQTPENPNNMPGMDMSHPPSMPEMPGLGDGNASAMHAMVEARVSGPEQESPACY